MKTTQLRQNVERFFRGLGEKYEPQVRQHLARVYMLLSAATLLTAIGAAAQISRVIDLGILAAIGSPVLVFCLYYYNDNGKNYYRRLGMLFSVGFCSGQTMGPLVQYILVLNPSIILTALVSTAVIFVSLSISALLAPRGKYLFLAGLLVSVINTMIIMNLLNIFFQSYFIQFVELYIGVIVMAAFILFDTQNIIEKKRAGSEDVIQHALDLFFDVLSVFQRLLIILTQKEERKIDDRRKRQ